MLNQYTRNKCKYLNDFNFFFSDFINSIFESLDIFSVHFSQIPALHLQNWIFKQWPIGPTNESITINHVTTLWPIGTLWLVKGWIMLFSTCFGYICKHNTWDLCPAQNKKSLSCQKIISKLKNCTQCIWLTNLI